MRAKQSTSQLTQSSLAQTILPSAANDANRLGRKSRSAAPSAPVVERPAAVVEAPPPPPAAQPPAPVWSPPSPPAPVWSPPSPPAMAAAPPDWGMSPSRYGSAPATDYPVNYPAAPGFPPQPHYT